MDDNYSQEKTISHYPYGITIALLGFALLIVSGLVSSQSAQERQSAQQQQNKQPQQEEQQPVNVFSTVDLTARSAFVWDVKNEKVLYEKNARAQLPLASLTKLMTAYTASEMLPQQSLITILPQSIQTEGNSNLRVGEQWEWHDLMDFTLISSSNDGADALAHAAASHMKMQQDVSSDTEDIFIEEMNSNARSIGLQETYFINETGLDPSTDVSGAYGSARDIAYLVEHMIQKKPELIEATRLNQASFTTQNNFRHTAENTNDLVNTIPGLIASKTGYTDLAGGNLAVAFDASIGHPVVVVVLGSTFEGRFDDVQELVRVTRRQLSQ